MRVAVIGLGLIGGSMGLALKQADFEVVGFARRGEVAQRALAIGAVDRAEADLASAVEGAQMVIIATPVLAMKEILAQLGRMLPHSSVVSDTASTKEQVMGWAQESLPPGVSFIGGHPMAGKEILGIEAAEAELFRGCIYCLVPGENASEEAISLVEGLVKKIGAKPLFLDATEHDSLVAGISHLPLLLSTALVSATSKSPQWPKMAKLAASGFRDLSRLASGSPQMSRDICLTNREHILRCIDEFSKELGKLRRLLSEGGDELEEAFLRAREARERWLQGG